MLGSVQATQLVLARACAKVACAHVPVRVVAEHEVGEQQEVVGVQRLLLPRARHGHQLLARHQ
jgi:hypothetical protein